MDNRLRLLNLKNLTLLGHFMDGDDLVIEVDREEVMVISTHLKEFHKTVGLMEGRKLHCKCVGGREMEEGGLSYLPQDFGLESVMIYRDEFWIGNFYCMLFLYI
jgi:hypothetical protein